MTSSSRKHAQSPDDHEGSWPKKQGKKHAQKLTKWSKKQNSKDSLEESHSDEDSSSDSEMDYDEFMAAAHAVTCCIDMFCNIVKVIKGMLYVRQEEAMKNSDFEEDKMDCNRHWEYLAQLPMRTVDWYKQAYYSLLQLAPGLKLLIDNASWSGILNKVT
ncbi:hypothetical protein BS17DRAFT_769364 [Gyrodon lividus]|nr:hypothetical protein BS17DRAFT_769364 [Gyrodon lividus]